MSAIEQPDLFDEIGYVPALRFEVYPIGAVRVPCAVCRHKGQHWRMGAGTFTDGRGGYHYELCERCSEQYRCVPPKATWTLRPDPQQAAAV